jgi:hypothetical protein
VVCVGNHVVITGGSTVIGRPEEAGAVAAFRLPDLASHVTGQELAVDSGLLGTLHIRQAVAIFNCANQPIKPLRQCSPSRHGRHP